jgi:hypothetical protein
MERVQMERNAKPVRFVSMVGKSLKNYLLKVGIQIMLNNKSISAGALWEKQDEK